MGRGKKIILGVDIGGSKIRVLSSDGKFWEFKTPGRKKDFIGIMKKLPKANSVNVGVAGVVRGTEVVFSPNIKYLKNYDFKKIFSRVRVDNDARFFLRREIIRSRAQGRVLGITIGTGIGRAYAERGKVRKIKVLEYPEIWEKEYQKIRDRKNDSKLAAYLVEKINLIIKKYRAEAVILGGGVLGRKGFYKKLKEKLKIKTYA
ncbi:hypothetical protein A3H65_01120 [Candidatus Giovannonibacteria bacterium RIFCSPLOWO2_02_FULL_45_14]|uniref:ROK family protein n=1 Tax=Candidatus Giovannonibacteria bacterium RIFCSPLOWO2_12_FULL_44_15 TaxID=1798364 RepID=A0A1F5Y063_9BACT|nr:MAG: hypothetical protein A3C75_01300 [Candidatus Giovannonibacteria bacterium RIFCSPHIGHO2_02_FULL_44_31]OGF76377.1 MAG: hypothetical protein A3E62_00540 [Candidatus Giovannonibacteria bacterium RIFCSPHIGHO2_12_FULL_44_29]OGF90941.1 MAG: hypothetical protein A3H65_01120 [Candidatus Giovannonibacteria bacterium RIFCSPLOWO2_02_FULL_45_14]OGF93460.1 MAG: hypothetical protein A3G54_04190 [Candidatus Giovannonibacteria bacterium RIFCSPLOWO2_12_FULL_44_15]